MTDVSALDPYIDLLGAYVERRDLDGGAFREAFLDRFLADETDWKDEEFEALDAVFGVAELYEPDPEIRGMEYSGEDELRAGATEALARLRALAATAGTEGATPTS